MTQTPAPQAFLDLADRLADAAGQVIRGYFRQPVEVDDKADASPVTIADREAERVMRGIIAETFPDHGIFGEEWGPERMDAEFVWVLDPIDGTKAFISGKPSFGTLIACLRHGKPFLGLIDQPITRERWLGAPGHPTTLNGQPIRTRACDAIAKATLYATGPDMFAGDDIHPFNRLSQQVKLTRFGADCYAYGLLAAGFVDLVCENSLKPWDYLCMVPVIEGAGGRITDWEGQPLTLQSGASVIAAGDAAAHAQALAVLKGSHSG